MSKDITAILADPQAYGFEFVLDTVKEDGRPYSNVPIVVVRDLAKFDSNFPGLALKAVNGQSIRVGSQRVGREYASGHPAEPQERRNETICRRNVEWLLGIRTLTVKEVFKGPEGQAFETEEEAKAAWLEWAQAQ